VNLGRPFQVIGPTLDGDVLAALARADRALTGRALERETGGSHGGVQRALEHLVAEGIVTQEPAGRAHLYRLNRDHLASPHVEALAALRLELIRRLRAAIGRWTVQPAASALFGSAARGDAGRDSDVDLLVVRPGGIAGDEPEWRRQLAELQSSVSTWTGNDARVLEYGAEEVDPGEPVLEAAAREGIELSGSLRRLLARVHGDR
jgi:predicted nucleotidyltransferase